MSSNFNNAKIINVYYNKGDRKPYDVNGKPIAYIGQESIGATEATTIRFYLGEDLDSSTAVIVTKRPDNERRLDLCEKFGTGVNSYYEVTLNAWYGAIKGKATLAFKVYNGDVEFDDVENPTEIISVEGRIVVSDIFNLEIAYAPEADLVVPPDDTEPYQDWFFALSSKLDKADSITVAGALPTLTGDVYDDRYFYVEDEGVGRLYYINGSSAIEVVFQVGTLKLTATGNGELTADTGKLSWNQPNGTAQLGLYNNVNIGLGEDIFYYGKASATITKGQVIQFAGREGDHILMKPAVPSEINANPKLILGIAKHNIANNDFGYVAHFGKIEGYDSGAFAVGSLLWFDSGSGSNGLLTATQPTAPNAKILMAALIKAETSSAANNGVLQVRIDIEPKLEELQNVLITSATNGNVLAYDGTKWINSTRLTTAETDIANIEDGTTIVGKALGDQNGNTIDTTYLTIASGSSTYVPLSSKGVANGVAPLGADNKIPSIHLPGGVDDIKEFANLASFPVVGESSIIYVALDTNIIYRWSGSAYVEISSSLALGTTSSTAFPGDRGLATETKTDNIVDGTQTLTNTRITNSAVGTSPLIVNGIASTTAVLQEWQLNSSIRASLTNAGYYRGAGIHNLTSANNSLIDVGANGIVIERNINNTNPTLIVKKWVGTGNILELQTGTSDKKLEIDVNGWFFQNGTRFIINPGTNNTFVGVSSGNTAVSGTGNTALGRLALGNITSGSNNIGIGVSVLENLSAGSSNTSVGFQSGLSITSGGTNTFLGRAAGFNASQLATATNSTALGFEAFTDKSNQMVFGNASVSEFVFNRNTSALMLLPQITASSGGIHTLQRTTGNTTTTAGGLTIQATSSGDMGDGFGVVNNFAIRDTAGVDNEIASIGAVRSGADNSGRLVLRTATTGTSTEKMTILPDGKVGIGTASPATLLDVVGGSIRLDSAQTIQFGDSSTRIVGRPTSATGLFRIDTGNTARFNIDVNGLVGINETSPSAQLQVKSGAINRVPLIVDTLASGHTANIVEFIANNSLRVLVGANGLIRTTNGLANMNSTNNSNIAIGTLGTNISRNVADTNPALIVDLVNASATGNIQVWQKAGSALSQISNAGIFVGQTRPTQNEQTGNYTLALADEGKVLRVNSSSNRTITIPKNSVVAFPIDTEIAILRYGTGTVSIAPVDGDVTLQSADGERKIRNRYGSVALKKIGENEWVLVGSLEA